MRATTDAMLANLQADSTKPVYVVQIAHGSTPELLSASGPVEFDGEDYAGFVNVSTVTNGESATLTLPATAQRAMQVQNGIWRNGYCKIYALPALPADGNKYTSAEGLLVLDGVILTSVLARNTVQVSVVHKYLAGKTTPGDLYDAVCNHMPAPGTVLVWEGERLILERAP